MATYPPTCSNTNTSQGMNMANSIANLRLKAKEYSLNQVPTVNWEEERLGAHAGGEGTLSAPGPLQADTVSGMSSISHSLDHEISSPFWSSLDGALLHLYAKCWTPSDGRIFSRPPFLLSWASLNSSLYKKTSRLDAVAEYLRSFTFVIVTEMEGEYFKDHFVFKQRTCSRRRLVYGLRGIPFVPLAVVLDKTTHQIWDQQYFFSLLKSTTNRQWLPLTFTHF